MSKSSLKLRVLEGGKVIEVPASQDKDGSYSYRSPKGWGVSFIPSLHFISEALDVDFSRTYTHIEAAGIYYFGDWSFIRDAEPDQLSKLVRLIVGDLVIMNRLKELGLSSYEMGRALVRA